MTAAQLNAAFSAKQDYTGFPYARITSTPTTGHCAVWTNSTSIGDSGSGCGAGGGGVTSVNGSGGTTGLTVTGGPIVSSGTLTLGGTLGVSNGGTGLASAPTNGQIDIGNGTNFTRAAITAGSGITVTNGVGSITIAAASSGGLTNTYDITNAAYGCAKSSSTASADQASCIQAAINAAATAGGGIVWVPVGFWNLKSQVIIKPYVTVQCASNGYVYGSENVTYSVATGSIFSVLWGSGAGNGDNPADAAFKIQAGGHVLNCGGWYPSQSASAATPTEYGSLFLIADVSANVDQGVSGSWCANCYNFIDFRGGISGIGVGSCLIQNNLGSPIHYGIALNFLVDWCTIGNNSMNSGAIWNADPTPSSHLRGWIAANGVAYYVGHSDLVTIGTPQAWGYGTGLWADMATVCCGGFTDGGGIIVRGPQFDSSGVAGFRLTGAVQALVVSDGNFIMGNPYTTTGGPLVKLDNSSSVTTTLLSNLQLTTYGTAVLSYNGSGQTVGNVFASNVWTSVPSAANYAFNIGAAATVSVSNGMFTGFASGILNAGTFTNSPTLSGAYQ